MDRPPNLDTFPRTMNPSLSQALFGDGASPEPGPGPRPGVATIREIDAAIEKLPSLSERNRELIRALALLWHDHHDAAHAIVQDIETRDGSYIHAILHRREPDYFNAKYWFRRVGPHPCLEELARQAGILLEKRNLPALAKKLLPGGQWDSFAFVDACEAAAVSAAPNHEALREIQRAEFEILLEHLGR